MKQITFDCEGLLTAAAFHDALAENMDFPEYYGKNLDAFWDCISFDCDVDFVTIVGSKTLPSDLKPTMQEIILLLEENKQEWANTDCPFDYEITS